MQILIATDGSAQATIACELGRNLAALEPAEIRFAAVLPPMSDLLDGAWPGAITIDPEPLERTAREQLESRLREEVDRTAETLRPSGVVLRGMPAERIAAEASEWAADMIVVGSRGRGTVTTMLFGSVSEELIDRAPVPVLVARRPAMRSILVAVDPSPAAHSAIGFVAAHRVFRGLDATVVGVAPEAFAWWFGLADGDPASIEAAYDARDSVEHDEEASAAEAQAALRSAGLRVSTRIVRGNPGDELSRLATELAVDTIVIGTRGRTGLSRLLLGSVTRGVLHHTGCSVVVVHGEPPTQPVPPTTKHEQSADREPARSRSEP